MIVNLSFKANYWIVIYYFLQVQDLCSVSVRLLRLKF